MDWTKRSWTWFGPGRPVMVGGVQVPGFVYVGQDLRSVAKWSIPEPALLDTSLPVDHVAPDWAGAGLRYWPFYHDLSPGSRAAYLAWHGGGRRDPFTAIGHVFLVTDSEDAYAEMCESLTEDRVTHMLYRDYLRSFRISSGRAA